MMMDQELDKIEDKIDMVEINTSPAREHVGKIERIFSGSRNEAKPLCRTSLLRYSPARSSSI
jgi:hypothetical protein